MNVNNYELMMKGREMIIGNKFKSSYSETLAKLKQ
jgi:hypothetical protein